MSQKESDNYLQRVQIKPAESVVFVGRLDTNRETFLSMKNPSKVVISFKIKQSKHVSVTPHYGYIRPGAELLIKLKAKVMKQNFDKEKLKISLVQAPRKAPRNAKLLWPKKKKLPNVFTRIILIVFQTPEDLETASSSEKTESENATDSGSSKEDYGEDTEIE